MLLLMGFFLGASFCLERCIGQLKKVRFVAFPSPSGKKRQLIPLFSVKMLKKLYFVSNAIDFSVTICINGCTLIQDTISLQNLMLKKSTTFLAML